MPKTQEGQASASKDKSNKEPRPGTGFVAHGAEELPGALLKSYNLEIKDEEGFIGDRASGRAFRAVLDEVRAQVSEVTEGPARQEADQGDLEEAARQDAGGWRHSIAAGVIHGAIEEFSKQLAGVVRRYLRLKTWRDTERIVVGGGIRQSRVGELDHRARRGDPEDRARQGRPAADPRRSRRSRA